MKSVLLKSVLVAMLGLSGAAAPAQSILGMGSSGVIGLPDTTHYGDTISGMSVWVVNRGLLPVAGLLVTLNGLTNTLSNPIQLGTLDLTLGLLAAGDSTQVPLDYFVVTPQNSNNGANIMVIWPTAPGSSTGDSTDGPYWVDGSTFLHPAARSQEVRVYPNPATDELHLDLPSDLGESIELVLTDLQGREVLHARVSPGHKINLPSFPGGILLYQVIADGKPVWSGKLRIEEE